MIEGDLDREAEGIYDRMNGDRRPRGGDRDARPHPDPGGAEPDAEVTEVLFAFKARILDLKNDQRFRYILLFKNHGAAAGATLEHAH